MRLERSTLLALSCALLPRRCVAGCSPRALGMRSTGCHPLEQNALSCPYFGRNATWRPGQLVFYNRVPKAASTTMLRYIEHASTSLGDFYCTDDKGWPDMVLRRRGEEAGWFDYHGNRRVAFDFFQSTDFDSRHFHPDERQSRAVASAVRELAGSHNALFERHIHFIDFEALGLPRAVYINVLRDPIRVRASAYYFYRDCVCGQRPGYTDAKGFKQEQDQWCKADWHRSSPTLCAMDVDQCYADLDRCREQVSAGALGGTVTLDFLCGTLAPCAATVPLADRLSHAMSHLRDKYLWVGVVERLSDSLRVLQRLLPDFFGTMTAEVWGRKEFKPDGTLSQRRSLTQSERTRPSAKMRARNRTDSQSVVAPETAERMRRQPEMAAELALYECAVELLDCRLHSSCAGAERHKLCGGFPI